MSELRRQIAQKVRNAKSPEEFGDIISELITRIELGDRVGVNDPNEPPLIDGCRIVHRGDGFYVCKVHTRYWKAGTEMCPGRRGL